MGEHRALEILIWQNHLEPGGNALKDQAMFYSICIEDMLK